MRSPWCSIRVNMSSRARLAICGVLLFTTSLLAYGYRMDGNNQAVQLALVKWLNDPSLYPNDPYAVSLGYYGSSLWPLVAWFAKFIPLQPLLFGLFVVERLLGIAAAAALARKFAPKSSLAAVAAMVLMAWPIAPMLGGGTIVKRNFEQTGFSIPFFLFAAAAFLDSRKAPWAILLAIGFNLNSIYGIFAVAYFAGAFLLSAPHRLAWRQWLAACVTFLALASPALVRGFSLMHRSSSADDAAWMSAASVRSSYHLYPLTWGISGYKQFGLLLGILLFFLWKNRHTARPLVAQGIAWTAVCCGWLGLAFAAAYVIKKPSLLMLQPGRATDLWVCVASILAVSLAALDLDRTAENRLHRICTRVHWCHPPREHTLPHRGLRSRAAPAFHLAASISQRKHRAPEPLRGRPRLLHAISHILEPLAKQLLIHRCAGLANL